MFGTSILTTKDTQFELWVRLRAAVVHVKKEANGKPLIIFIDREAPIHLFISKDRRLGRFLGVPVEPSDLVPARAMALITYAEGPLYEVPHEKG